MADATSPLNNAVRGRYIVPSISSDPVQVDPAAPGTVMRYALAIEAGFNIVGATGMILYPSRFLSPMVTNQSQVSAASASLVQWVGGLLFVLTVPILLCTPNTRRAIESRPTVYYTLLAGEGTLIPILLYQAAAAPDSGLTPKALLLFSSGLVMPLAWRLFVLFKRPEWMGRYRDARKQA